MKCPHCLQGIHFTGEYVEVTRDKENVWTVLSGICPECSKAIIFLRARAISTGNIRSSSLIHPKALGRAPVPSEVPAEFADDYTEACLVLADSPKASAALSRRCLQRLLRAKGGVKPQDLSAEIDEVMPKLPSHLAEAVDGIRTIGNFAAHPLKSKNAGEILDVEAGEAEWLLDVLEQLFALYFVQPAVLAKKRAELDKKLQDSEKPPRK